jgi:hypothetical protein
VAAPGVVPVVPAICSSVSRRSLQVLQIRGERADLVRRQHPVSGHVHARLDALRLHQPALERVACRRRSVAAAMPNRLATCVRSGAGVAVTGGSGALIRLASVANVATATLGFVAGSVAHGGQGCNCEAVDGDEVAARRLAQCRSFHSSRARWNTCSAR